VSEFSLYVTYSLVGALGLSFGAVWVLLLYRKPGQRILSLGSIGYVLVSGIWAAFILFLAYSYGLLSFTPINSNVVAASYAAVFALGSVFGISELISRYRDEPRRALVSWAALLYISVNALASVFALNVIRVFNWVADDDSLQVAYKQVMIAGLGAMALFRSSLFIFRIGNSEINFGPVFVLQIILGVTDRAVDRRRGQSRSSDVGQIMKNVSFDKAKELLPIYCLALMQNLSKEEQEALGRDIASIAAANISDPIAANRQKSVLLGLRLLSVIGTDLLQQAVNALGDDIKTNT
jgi:hypothetical protein